MPRLFARPASSHVPPDEKTKSHEEGARQRETARGGRTRGPSGCGGRREEVPAAGSFDQEW